MSGQCSICLSAFKDPVCIPCGHVYCSSCLGDHINMATKDGYSASCPTCRSAFHIVSPELTCLPKQIHRFVTPSMRRVYLEPSVTVQGLEQKLTNCMAQIENLKQESERLMDSCEKYMHQSIVHAEGEAEARIEVDRLEGLLRQERRKTRLAAEEADKWRERYERAKEELEEKPQQNRSGHRVSLASKRSIDGLSFSDDAEQVPSVSALTPRRRVIRALPQSRPKKKLRNSVVMSN